MSETHDHLNRLAERGNPRGADAVVAAAVAAAGKDVEIVPVSLSDDATRPARKGRSAFAAGGIAALLGVATLAISALVGGSGADSPEAAVRQLADAISREDPLAAVGVIAPEEVRTLRSTLDAAGARAAELELVNSAGAPLAGLDLSISGLDLSTEELAPGFTKVYVRAGTAAVRSDVAGFSPLLQRALADARGVDDAIDLVSVRPVETDPFVVAVERDGSWYVSAAYTILEYIRVSEGAPSADYGSARASAASLGAGTPEAAAEDMLRAVAQGDWLRVLALVAPDEIPVYDYRDLILAMTTANRSNPELTVEEFSATAEVDGDAAVVDVQAVASNTSGERYRFADDCASNALLVYDGDTVPDEACLSVLSFVPFTFSSQPVADNHSVRVTAVEREGRWFLSPVGTVIDYLDQAVAGIDRRWVYALLGLAHELEIDATITLDQPVERELGVRVYEFAASAGQRIIGTTDDECCSLSAQLYRPDGSADHDAWGLFEGQDVLLGVDGTYKLVVYSYTGGSFTLWDSANAPAAAFESPFPDDFVTGESCTLTSDGGVECTESGPVTATTAVP